MGVRICNIVHDSMNIRVVYFVSCFCFIGQPDEPKTVAILLKINNHRTQAIWRSFLPIISQYDFPMFLNPLFTKIRLIILNVEALSTFFFQFSELFYSS